MRQFFSSYLQLCVEPRTPDPLASSKTRKHSIGWCAQSIHRAHVCFFVLSNFRIGSSLHFCNKVTIATAYIARICKKTHSYVCTTYIPKFLLNWTIGKKTLRLFFSLSFPWLINHRNFLLKNEDYCFSRIKVHFQNILDRQLTQTMQLPVIVSYCDSLLANRVLPHNKQILYHIFDLPIVFSNEE